MIQDNKGRVSYGPDRIVHGFVLFGLENLQEWRCRGSTQKFWPVIITVPLQIKQTKLYQKQHNQLHLHNAFGALSPPWSTSSTFSPISRADWTGLWLMQMCRLGLWDPGTRSCCQALPVMPSAFASVSLSSNLNLSILFSSQFLHKLRDIISFRCLECSKFGWNWLVVSKFREKPQDW